MKNLIYFLALTLTLFGLSQQLAAQGKPETFKIGFGGAILGDSSAYGLSSLYGLEVAVHHINAVGGLLGQQVEIVQENDGCDPSLASFASTKLIGQNLKVIFGHSCSGATRNALNVYGNKAVVISASSTENSLTEDGKHPYFFRTTPRDAAQADKLSNYIRRAGFKNIAILHDKALFGQSMAENIREALKAKAAEQIKIGFFDGVNAGTTSFKNIIEVVKKSGAEALIWSGYYDAAARLVLQAPDNGLNIPFLGTDGLYNQRFVTMAGQAAEGLIVAGQRDLSGSKASQQAIASHKSRRSEDIGPYFFYSIGAAQAWFAAVEKAGDAADFPAIKKRLTEETVETVMGPVRFDARGDVIGASYSLFRLKNGLFEEIN
ncbi:MAG: branched-chain amino acid ABC transporter substrate-binding protein [Deltaproteobacteria bacterium]|jgi:branched-chain amino acid transport system substrate-binding protein|nr:branched-chain amino acid ABC transporter substrate-binding protein [Deltaproteobacteria bacterium]